MSGPTAQQALELWQQAGLLPAEQAAELRSYLAGHPQGSGSSRFVSIISVIGAVLAGLGLVLFVAGHWDAIGPVPRVAILVGAYLGVAAVAFFASARGYSGAAAALWLVASLAVGANIFLLGQIFNFSLTFWQGPFLWLIAVLVMGWATRSAWQAWLAIPLALLALGWFGGGQGWFTDDQFEALFSASGLRPLFAVIGLILVCIGLLVRRSGNWRFAARTWIGWGVLLGAIPLVSASFDQEVFLWVFAMEPQPKHWVVIGASGLLLIAALVLGEFRAQYTGMAITFVAIVIYLLLLLGATGYTGLVELLPVFLIYVLVVFLMALLVVWSGIASHDSMLVNIGVGSVSVFILGQYFAWSLQLLDRALAFTVGGVLLIAIAWWAEHQRRRLLQEMAS